MKLSVGVDLVSVRRIEDSLSHFGDRFLRRVFTEGEVAYANAAPAQTHERLAARFAAKEASMKALGLAGGDFFFRDIEVVNGPSGAPTLRLHGRARELARGAESVSVSLSHEGEFAIAVVVTHGSHEPPAHGNPNAENP